MASERETVAIVTVHGTGDQKPAAQGEPKKWWEPDSVFAGWLTDRLAKDGVRAEIHPLVWSGENSSTDREKAATELAKTVRRLSRTYAGVHVVAHSHGGNIADEAAARIGWNGVKKREGAGGLRSVSTVGTPFFRTTLTASEQLGAVLFGIMTLLSFMLVIALIINGEAVLGLIAPFGLETDPAAVEAGLNALADWLRFVGVIGLVILALIAPVAGRGLLRLRRTGQRRARAGFLSIWHREDEAIAFLQRVETAPIEPIKDGALWSASRTGAILWAVPAVFALPLLGGLTIAADALLTMAGRSIQFSPYGFGEAKLAAVALQFLLFGVAGAPIIFAGVYLLYRAVALVGFELAGRAPLNQLIAGALRGIAFGRDGDSRVGAVASRSHRFGAYPLVIDGALADRMRVATSDSSRRLFDKYRAGAFEVDSSQTDFFDRMRTDVLTWASLIHTTYFDHEEIAAAVAGHIASVERAAGGAEPLPEPEPPVTARRPGGATSVVAGLLRGAVFAGTAFGLVVGGALVAPGLVNRDALASRKPSFALPPPPYKAFQTFRDCEGCPEMVALPGGSFVMGSPTGEAGRWPSEGPLRKVAVEPFAIGKFEVTKAEFAAFSEATGRATEAGCRIWNSDARSYELSADKDWRNPGFVQERDHPVTCISWEDAKAYVAWLNSKIEGAPYRLLSEAEWEYAARGGTPTRYSWGDEDPVCDPKAPNSAQYRECKPPSTAAIESFPPNPFGLYDMAGNVWEWSEDCYADSYAYGQPSDASPYTVENCQFRVLRGGSWNNIPRSLRSALRIWSNPTIRDNDAGFRLARTLLPPAP